MWKYLAALVLLAAPALAQVPDDSDWALGGELVNVDVAPDGSGGYTATATDSSGFSNPVNCIVDAAGNGIVTTAQMETPGGSYRIVNSRNGAKVTKLTGRGKNTYMKKVRNKRAAKGVRKTTQYSIAPSSGPVSAWPFTSPGETVTSLPFPGISAPSKR